MILSSKVTKTPPIFGIISRLKRGRDGIFWIIGGELE